MDEDGIFVKIFSGKEKPCDEINIAYLPISESEVSLVVKEYNTVYIGFLLLHRTLSYIGNGNFA